MSAILNPHVYRSEKQLEIVLSMKILDKINALNKGRITKSLKK